MKKSSLFTLAFASILALSIPAIASAASVGNPDTLGKPGAIALGLEYDNSHTNLALKHGAVIDGDMVNPFGDRNMQLDSKTTYATITVGILENLDAFAGMGMNNSDLGFDMTYPEGGSDNIRLDDNAVIAYKVGVKSEVAKIAGIQIGVSAQYSRLKLDKKFSVNGNDLGSLFWDPATYRTKTKINEWQAAVTASKQMGRFNPYAGLILAKVSADHNTVVNVAAGEGPAYSVAVNAEARQESLYTGVIGANVAIIENLNANLEFRSGNQDAVTAALNYTF